MNQEGWGFKDFIVILGIIMGAVIITFIIYQITFKPEKVTDPVETTKQTVSSYDKMEYDLKKSAQRYQNDHYSGNIDDDETWILSSKLLTNEGYLKIKLIDINDSSIECTGYVRFIKKGASISYRPYLKCGNNYMTDGYDSNYVE